MTVVAVAACALTAHVFAWALGRAAARGDRLALQAHERRLRPIPRTFPPVAEGIRAYLGDSQGRTP